MVLSIAKFETKTTAALLLVLALVVAAPALAQQGGGCKIGTGPVAPASGAVLSPDDPLTLEIDVTATPNTPDCQHNATGWQVATDAGFALDALVFDSGAHAFDLRSITIQPPLLQPGTTYWWRARVQVTNGGIFEWIEIKDTFSTSGLGSGPGGSGPVVWGLTPTLGVPGTAVTVNGSGFVIAFDPVFGPWQSEVLFDGTAVPTSFIGNFELEFAVPAGAACGPHDVRVRNPDPTVFIPAVSNAETFEIPCAQPPPGGNVPAPQINSLAPSSATPGETVRVLGSGFLEFLLGEVSTVHLDGSPLQTAFVSASELRFTVPPLIPCGPNGVQVVTTLIGGAALSSNVVPLDVPCGGGGGATPPTPLIARLSPDSGPAGTQVAVVGSGFVEGSAQLVVVPGSEVLFGGTALATRFVSGTELGFTVPAGAACGDHDVRVRTESPVVGDPARLSNAVPFEVTCPGNPPPGGGANQPPTADFGFSPGAPQAGEAVRFTNRSADPDGAADIASVRWSFGDGTASTQANASHAYAAAGSYTVTLTVTDQAGLSDQIAKQIQVSSAGSGAATRSVAQAIAALVPNDPDAANADRIVGDREILRAVAMWVKGEVVPDTGGARIGDGAMIDLIKRWIGGQPLSAAGVPMADARARAVLAQLAGLREAQPLRLDAARLEPRAAGGWTLRLEGSGIARHAVRVYDMAGRLLHSAEGRGDRAALVPQTRDGRRLANGVYLVAVTALDASGAQQRHTVVKWAVRR